MSRNEKSRRGFDPLVYRFQDEAPEPGKVTQVADGVFWARLPLWGRLNHINVWLLKDYDGWTVVDTGIHTDEVKAIWETLFVEVLGGQPITRVIATHLHTDHTGNAGWLAQKFDCPLWMSRSDLGTRSQWLDASAVRWCIPWIPHVNVCRSPSVRTWSGSVGQTYGQ